MIENIIFGIIFAILIILCILLKYYFSVEYYNKYFKFVLAFLILIIVIFFVFLKKYISYNINEDYKLLGKYTCEESKNNLFSSIVDKNIFINKNNCIKKIDELNKNIIIEGEEIQERVIIEENTSDTSELTKIEKFFIVVDISDTNNIYIEDLKLYKDFIKKNGINFNNTFNNEEDALNYIYQNSIYLNDKNSDQYSKIINKIYYIDSENILRSLSTNVFIYDKLKIKNYSKNLLLYTDENKKNTNYLEIGKKIFCTKETDITTKNFFVASVFVDKKDEYTIKKEEKFKELQKIFFKDNPELEDINEYIKWVNIYENSDIKLNYDMILNNPTNVNYIKIIKEHNLDTSTQTNVICKKRVLQQIFNNQLDNIKYLTKLQSDYFNEHANYCDITTNDKIKNYNYFYFDEKKISKIPDEIFKDFMYDNETRLEHSEEKKACIRRINMHYNDIIGTKTLTKKDYEDYNKHLIMCDEHEKVYIPLEPPKIKIIQKMIDDNKHFANSAMKSSCIENNKIKNAGENLEKLFDSQGNFDTNLYYNDFIRDIIACRNY